MIQKTRISRKSQRNLSFDSILQKTKLVKRAYHEKSWLADERANEREGGQGGIMYFHVNKNLQSPQDISMSQEKIVAITINLPS